MGAQPADVGRHQGRLIYPLIAACSSGLAGDRRALSFGRYRCLEQSGIGEFRADYPCDACASLQKCDVSVTANVATLEHSHQQIAAFVDRAAVLPSETARRLPNLISCSEFDR
jgi:hypothetical protein